MTQKKYQNKHLYKNKKHLGGSNWSDLIIWSDFQSKYLEKTAKKTESSSDII